MAKNSKKEEFTIDGSEVVSKVKEIIKEGNARRIIIKNKRQNLDQNPSHLGSGAVFLPVFAAVGALTALVTKCQIIVEKK